MNEKSKNEEKELDLVMILVSLIYVAGVIVSVVLFLSYILAAFAADQYATRFIMGIGVMLVGASSIGLPLYIHNKAVDQKHRITAIVLYAGEIAIMFLNVIVSFTFLLSQNNANVVVPDWMMNYEPYSVFSIVYVVATWAIVFSVDPAWKDKLREKKAAQRLRDIQAQRVELEAEQEALIFEQEKAFLKSVEGEDFILESAKKRIAEKQLQNENGKKHFGSGVGSNSVPSMTYAADANMPTLDNPKNAPSQ